MLSKRKTSSIMTEGVIWKQLVFFAIPLLIGNLFQQLYNTVDSIVVGNFVSKQALAAVGSTGPIINTLVGFFMGLATGSSVVISQYYGARDYRNLRLAVHTTLIMTFGLCIVFTFAGIAIVPYMLRFMKTPEDVFAESAAYLRIYFAGVSGLMLYNIGSGILRAIGDSRRPLYFLCFSSVINIGLDLLFVLAFKMGIAGVACATIISQFCSAVLVLIVLSNRSEPYGIVWRELRLSKAILKVIVRVGLPAGLQQAVTSFSNVFVQSYINVFGSSCMAGWTSYGKIDQFVMLPMQSLSLASTTFVGQNLGAHQLERAKKGMHTSLYMAIGTTVFLAILLNIFASQLLYLFNQDPEVLHYGLIFVRFMSPFYVLCCWNQIYAGALRGAGDSKGPMIILLSSFVVFRQIYLFVASHLFDSIYVTALAYPMGWLLCSVLVYIHYRRGKWEKNYSLLVSEEDAAPAGKA